MDVCLIPARSGSKRIKNKNILSFFGNPMISYSIKTAIKSKLFDKILVTTDSKKIAKLGSQLGFHIPGLRPKYLSTGQSNVFDTHKFVFKKMDLNDDNSIVCIVNNNPFIKSEMIKKTYKKFRRIILQTSCFSSTIFIF